MNQLALRIPAVLTLLVVWMLLTAGGGWWIVGDDSRIDEILGGGFLWHIGLAAGLVCAAVASRGALCQAFAAPLPGSLRSSWLPLLYLALFASLSGLAGFPPLRAAGIALINTLLVGLSEEVMFRGLLYPSLRRRFGIWTAVLLSSAVFGAVHVLNVFMVGNLFQALLQATTASLTGVVLAALMLRSGSLVWPVVYHALWDFLTFAMISTSGPAAGAAPTQTPSLAHLVPIALVLPNFLFALWLIKALPRDPVALARA